MSIFFDTSLAELEAACGDSGDVETTLDRMMSLLASRAGKARWIEKTPGNAGAIPRILLSWSQSRFLHVVRDPRDVYTSLLESGKWCEPASFADQWCATFGAARDWLLAAGGSHPAYYEIRYERLVLEPEQALQQVLDFLQEPWEPQLACFNGAPEDFERVLRATGKESRTLRRLASPLTRSRVGVWRSVLEPERWDRVRAELERRGYGNVLDGVISETESFVSSEG